MMNVRDYLQSLRVDVMPPSHEDAEHLLSNLGVCRCADCKPLAHWLSSPPSFGALTLVQCSSIIAQVQRESCDECLAYGQMLNRRVGQVIHAANELPAFVAHALEEAHAVERDRLEARRIALWFEQSLRVHVGERARKLLLNVRNTPFTLKHLVEPHSDEYGLKFDEALRQSVRYGARVYLEHYGHLVK
jgi:hypothetical protein